MSTLATTRPTLLDVARATDPNGKIAKVVNVLQRSNEILDDIPWYEGNLPTGHQLTLATSKPTPYFRLLNQGIVPQKATSGQVTEACAIMENRNQIDINVARLNGNTESYRMSQDRPMIEGFSDTLASKLIYGDSSTTPEEFNGLATRYFSLGSTYLTSSQMIDAGGTGTDNTSIWLVCWGQDKVFGVYPKGSEAGLQYEDLGIQEVLTNATTGAVMRAYTSWMQWQVGLAVADYRYVVRICNIDYSNLQTASDGTDTSANLIKYMSLAADMIPSGDVQPVFYMNRAARAYLRVKMNDKSNLYLKDEQLTSPNSITRRPALTFQGIPCRVIDGATMGSGGILNTESRIMVSTT